MKKLALLLVCLFAMNANAQVTIEPGVRAGLNISTFTNTDLGSRSDFYVGGLLGIKLAKFYTLQPEIIYSRQGAKGTFFRDDYYGGDVIASNENYEIQYLSLALINKFKIVQGFHAVVGPNLDFRTGDNFSQYTERVEDFDIGLILGLGYTLPKGLTVEARIKMGFVDIFGNQFDEYDYYDDRNNDLITNSTIQLGLAYTF